MDDKALRSTPAAETWIMQSAQDLFLTSTLDVFKNYKNLADGALKQLDSDNEFFECRGPRAHSIAVVVKHVAGNLKSRWSSFLTTDGEKPDRDRDGEFEILAGDTRASLMEFWETGWGILFSELSALTGADLTRNVTIRGEPHSVILAVQRSLAHTAYHAGQILYLCRNTKKGDWNYLTVAPGASKEFNQGMRGRFENK